MACVFYISRRKWQHSEIVVVWESLEFGEKIVLKWLDFRDCLNFEFAAIGEKSAIFKNVYIFKIIESGKRHMSRS